MLTPAQKAVRTQAKNRKNEEHANRLLIEGTTGTRAASAKARESQGPVRQDLQRGK
ncbi:hypothetical protein QCA50_007342 [Cerrena zonata]|uniref:Small EDRK-rich factor-like N-terminal domain-containing protein n=1 Tax=Cerrena zonata TaxID=2478898 RepID=A0AAW0G7X4_9APHY